MSDPSKHIIYTAEDFQRYYAGEMTPQERHALEKAALDDPFLADALEGYVFTSTATSDVQQLKERLNKKKERKKTPVIYFRSWLKVAAVLLLLAGSCWSIYYFSNKVNIDKAVAIERSTKENDTTGSLSDSSVQIEEASTTSATATETPRDAFALEKSKKDKTYKQRADNENEDLAAKGTSSQMSPLSMVPDSASVAYNMQEVQAPSAANHSYSQRRFSRSKTDSATAQNDLAVIQQGDTVHLNVTMKATPDANKNMEVVALGAQSKSKQRRDPVIEELEPADGWSSYNEYLAKSLKEPDQAKEKNTHGEVELSFEVNSTGEPINIKVVRSLGKAFDEEAIRLLKEGPKWKKKSRNKGKVTIRF